MAIKKLSTNTKLNAVQNSLFASGGDEVTTVGIYRYHVFTTVGPNAFTVLAGTKSVDVMMCGGGGSGGFRIGGGGGGAELKTYTSVAMSPGIYTVVVGHAGSASGVGLKNNGGMSKLLLGQTSLLTALGGGAGGPQASGDGNIGGSGGGGSEWSLVGGYGRGGTASGSNTNAGGRGRTNPFAGGGGGGATSVGISAEPLNGPGGGGGQGFTLTNIDSNFSSANFNAFTGMTHVCSGGGGGGYTAAGGAGGTGGGQGGGNTIVGQAATSYGSGGGAGGNDTYPQSGAGFKGLVIIRYTLN